jgi:SAM-dependent methyltransferase
VDDVDRSVPSAFDLSRPIGLRTIDMNRFAVQNRTPQVTPLLVVPRPTDLYAAALRSMAEHSMAEPGGRHWYARYEDGPRRSLTEALRRWCGTADATDLDLLDRAPGAVLDLGCGPGRLVIELARQGRQAAGVDTSRVAVRLARKAGATALCRSIFATVPGEGAWDSVLLADGNIGIGGDPVALLRRCRDVIGPAGRVLVELDPPGTGMRAERVRLERGGQRGHWFAWAHVGADAIKGPAADAGLRVAETWERAGRSFAALVARPLGSAV